MRNTATVTAMEVLGGFPESRLISANQSTGDGMAAIGAGRRLRTSADPPLLLMQKRLHGTRGEPTFRDRAWDRDRVRRLWDRARAQIPALAADQAPGPRGMSAHTTTTAVTATATEADTGASTAGPLPSI